MVSIVIIFVFLCMVTICLYIAYKKHIGYWRMDISTAIFNQDDLNVFNKYDRFLVVGCPAVGKTTLCRQICSKYPKLHRIELDKLYWGKNWSHPNIEHFKMLIKQRMNRSKMVYIADGNYSSAKEILWSNAQVVIWLEYEFWEVMYRGIKRTSKRVYTQEKVCGNNRESLWLALTNGIPYWIWRCHGEFKYRIPKLSHKYSHVQIIKIPSPRHCKYWVDHLVQGEIK